MLIKLNPIFPSFARQEQVTQERAPLTKKQWVNIDRIVMAALFVSVIVGAILFS